MRGQKFTFLGVVRNRGDILNAFEEPSLRRGNGRLTCPSAWRAGTGTAQPGLSVRPALEDDKKKTFFSLFFFTDMSFLNNRP